MKKDKSFVEPKTRTMKTYIGSKLVKAKPTNLYVYREMMERGRNQTEEGEKETRGFLVEYPDGYQSWNTMDEFHRISRVITDDEYRSFFGVEPDGDLDENGFQWYIQTKVVNAEPMDNDDFKGDETPEGATQEDGYKVVYPNGHESWSPAVKFEEAYRAINGLEATLVKESWLQGQPQTNKPN